MSQTVATDLVIGVSYTLRDRDGQVLDEADESDPLYYLHGHDNLLPRVEEQMAGLMIGDSKSFEIPAADGYGEHDANAFQQIDRSHLPPDPEPEEGMALMADFGMGPQPYRITRVTSDNVTIDLNHPLAGVDLHFTMKVLAIRAATDEEIEHGHAHGPDGSHGHHH